MNMKQRKLIDNLPELKDLQSSKKGEIPVFDSKVVSPEVIEAVDKYITAARAVEAQDAVLTVNKPLILNEATDILDTLAADGVLAKSIKLAGQSGTVLVTRQDKFSVKAKSVDDLKKVFGAQFVADNFEVETSVSLNPEVLKNNALLKQLIDLVGKDRFAEFFVRTTDIKTKKGYDANIATLPEDLLKEARAGLVVQTAPSLKVG